MKTHLRLNPDVEGRDHRRASLPARQEMAAESPSGSRAAAAQTLGHFGFLLDRSEKVYGFEFKANGENHVKVI